jgi:hypothetical protein
VGVVLEVADPTPTPVRADQIQGAADSRYADYRLSGFLTPLGCDGGTVREDPANLHPGRLCDDQAPVAAGTEARVWQNGAEHVALLHIG